ncbi:hypothetical protein AUEXF2481DRAFT_442607 [Aureobasidium subglaciale EXF-2481]|uniref:F-box domain-containing protein n=1 Tax=Aureobasidium subglaciale (strain EXF-2481) TaxID=1043005 RepID=A0A074Y7U2_AURSE|nr:uncharacterized protein AUEXF2481DRAFT_442607 [Aureobasidium subglaciale EXF-2481]KAI5207229.1 hypothetical protein E4T38_03420 [Aureobasidium subglaciale]KAI5226188.1 hypothetical protein E4T40_03202 [Aureobasidium subglaciale]KAI5229572.1 hypothetical protein E4T41_03417 [Aureobasidium subglaciale]KAI5264155.1 hypothetical protein E4T46_03194 [Aureobasidium subglaciale]KEQ92034.1 hypothetical protein AUEXF2481DRAFT_442607 [Aureobasidium subglaciale EXF-2481]
MADTPQDGQEAGYTPFRLMDLPNELIRKVCCDYDLCRYDLMALRCTCKLICEFSSDSFARKCFRDITVLMSRSSLQAFIELSQHSRFGSVVNCINVSPAFTLQAGLTAIPLTTLPVVPEGVDPPQLVHDTASLEIIRGFLNRSREEREVKADASAEGLLNIAFKALAHRGQRFHLGFCDTEGNPVGARHLLGNYQRGQTAVWHLDWKSTIAKVVRAASDQGCKIEGLEFIENGRADSRNEFGFCTDGIERPLNSLCSQLTRLEVTFMDDDVETTSRSVKRIVSAAEHLVSLSLLQMGDFNDAHRRYFSEMLDQVRSPWLKDIHLAYFQITELELFAFIGRYGSTLEDLALWYGCLLTGTCISLVARLRDNFPHLEQLLLEETCEHGAKTICDGDELKWYSVRAGEDMQDRLGEILDGTFEEHEDDDDE